MTKTIPRALRFLPGSTSGYFLRKQGYTWNTNWIPRVPNRPSKSPLNQQTLGKIFGNIHHYRSHAPAGISDKWMKADERFKEHHLPNGSSSRFLNRFTPHRWL